MPSPIDKWWNKANLVKAHVTYHYVNVCSHSNNMTIGITYHPALAM